MSAEKGQWYNHSLVAHIVGYQACRKRLVRYERGDDCKHRKVRHVVHIILISRFHNLLFIKKEQKIVVKVDGLVWCHYHRIPPIKKERSFHHGLCSQLVSHDPASLAKMFFSGTGKQNFHARPSGQMTIAARPSNSATMGSSASCSIHKLGLAKPRFAFQSS